jgi:hypothetical protein
MTIETSTDIFATRNCLYPVLGQLTGEPATALSEAVGKPSPVDTLVEAMEALYGAVVGGNYAAGSETQIVHSCAQAAYLVAYYQWHGKTQRAADITVAMRAVDNGTAVSIACSATPVDVRFAPPTPVIPAAPPTA